MQCPDCGATVTDEVGYCFTCIRHVSSTPPQPVLEIEEAPKRRKARFSRSDSIAAEPLKASTVAKEPSKKKSVEETEVGSKATDRDLDDPIHRHVQELEEIFRTIKEHS